MNSREIANDFAAGYTVAALAAKYAGGRTEQIELVLRALVALGIRLPADDWDADNPPRMKERT